MARHGERQQGGGWLVFAAVMMFVAGFQNIIYGLAALEKDGYLTNRLLFQDLTFWGWLWLCVGSVEVIAAFGVVARNQFARWFGVAIASFNAIGQLAFLSAYPFWSIVIIALDVLIIYGLVTYDFPVGTDVGSGGRAAEAYPAETGVRRGEPARGHATVISGSGAGLAGGSTGPAPGPGGAPKP